MSGTASRRGAARRAGAILIALGAAALQASVQATELLGPSGVGFAVGRSPDDVAIADFDADGAPDLAVTNIDDGTVSVLLGDGAGGFSRVQDVTVGASPESLAVADLDGDGAQDLITANRDGNSVSVARGRGDGRFDPASEIAGVGAGPLDLAVTDLDADGVLDLAIVLRDANALSVLLGDGAGGFGAPSVIGGLGPVPISVAAGDFDGNDTVDLAVANVQGDSVSVLLGDGTGGFSAPLNVSVGSFPVFVTAGDFDTDGAPDLAVVNGIGRSVSVLLGQGNGTFVRRLPDIDVGQFPIAAAIGDLDDDGTPDLVVMNFDSSSASVLLGDGQGGFIRRCRSIEGGECSETSASSPRSVAVGDLNRDGATDLAIASQAGDSVTILFGDGLGGLVGAPEVAVGQAPQAVVARDFNGDGASDLAVANTLGNSVSVLLSDRFGGFVPGPDIAGTFEGPVALVTGDFNHDGDSDLAVANVDATTAHVSILLGDGSGGFVRFQDLGLQRNLPSSLALGDFDRDGNDDLVVVHSTRNLFDGNRASVLLGQGNGTFVVVQATLRIQDGGGVAGVGYLNADEDLDLVVTKSDGVQIFLGAGDGRFVHLTPDVTIGDAPGSVAVLDLNGDDVPDLAIPLFNQGRLARLLGVGNGTFVRRTPDIDVGDGPRDVATADFNADGFPDLAVSYSLSDSVGLLLGDGDGGFGRTSDLTTEDEPLGIAVADFDADGAPDLAVANHLDDSVSTFFNRLEERADLNGSNRVDGFDVAAIGRLKGVASDEAGYLRSADVDLNGVIDGDDLGLVAGRFGAVNRDASPLRAALEDPVPPADPQTVTLQQAAADGDLLRVRVMVNDAGDAASAADFAVTIDPQDGGEGQVLELVGYDPGTYLGGGVGQVMSVDARTLGRAEISALRFPTRDLGGAGPQPLMDLIFRARRTGEARLAFAPFRRATATLLFVDGCPDSTGCELGGVVFDTAALTVQVNDLAGGPPGRKIGFSPSLLDFGGVTAGVTARRTLRLSNFGFSDLQIIAVTSTLPEVTTFFACDSVGAAPPCAAISIPPFGFVELPVVFAPGSAGLFSGWLQIDSDDPVRPEVTVPVSGRSSAVD